jgi:hypothetical protein
VINSITQVSETIISTVATTTLTLILISFDSYVHRHISYVSNSAVTKSPISFLHHFPLPAYHLHHATFTSVSLPIRSITKGAPVLLSQVNHRAKKEPLIHGHTVEESVNPPNIHSYHLPQNDLQNSISISSCALTGSYYGYSMAFSIDHSFFFLAEWQN